MANIKALENAIKEWEAKEEEFKNKDDSIGQNTTGIVASSLKLALNIIKQPSNTQIQTSQPPFEKCAPYDDNCPFCIKNRGNLLMNFCQRCGRSLHE